MSACGLASDPITRATIAVVPGEMGRKSRSQSGRAGQLRGLIGMEQSSLAFGVRRKKLTLGCEIACFLVQEYTEVTPGNWRVVRLWQLVSTEPLKR